jgi:hypothetical protein
MFKTRISSNNNAVIDQIDDQITLNDNNNTNSVKTPIETTSTLTNISQSSHHLTTITNNNNSKGPSSFFSQKSSKKNAINMQLFGVKLEKLCGVYSSTKNNQLPTQIMSLLEKVANEGCTVLMIFRKSASAKVKKSFKDKLNMNEPIDYNEMSVHIAALLLKDYLRDYPDGIIDFNLYTNCIDILQFNDKQTKLEATKKVLNQLPAWNYVCLRHFMCLFCRIVDYCSVNKMDSHNISVCVAPSIFHKLDRPNDVESSFQIIAFIEYLINNCGELFGNDTFTLLKVTVEVNSKTEDNFKTTQSLSAIYSDSISKEDEQEHKSIENEQQQRSISKIVKRVNSRRNKKDDNIVKHHLFRKNSLRQLEDQSTTTTGDDIPKSAAQVLGTSTPVHKTRTDFGRMFNLVTLKGAKRSLAPNKNKMKLKASLNHLLFSHSNTNNKSSLSIEENKTININDDITDGNQRSSHISTNTSFNIPLNDNEIDASDNHSSNNQKNTTSSLSNLDSLDNTTMNKVNDHLYQLNLNLNEQKETKRVNEEFCLHTMSVDSGLSVPTVTINCDNNDISDKTTIEDEQFDNIDFNNLLLTEELTKRLNELDDNDKELILDDDEEDDGSSLSSLSATSSLSSQQQQQQLKRQCRMLLLNEIRRASMQGGLINKTKIKTIDETTTKPISPINEKLNYDCETNTSVTFSNSSFDTNNPTIQKKKESRLAGTESEGIFSVSSSSTSSINNILQTNKNKTINSLFKANKFRSSLKSIAPIAPSNGMGSRSSSLTSNSFNINNNQFKRINLVPYKIDSLPLTYQKKQKSKESLLLLNDNLKCVSSSSISNISLKQKRLAPKLSDLNLTHSGSRNDLAPPLKQTVELSKSNSSIAAAILSAGCASACATVTSFLSTNDKFDSTSQEIPKKTLKNNNKTIKSTKSSKNLTNANRRRSTNIKLMPLELVEINDNSSALSNEFIKTSIQSGLGCVNKSLIPNGIIISSSLPIDQLSSLSEDEDEGEESNEELIKEKQPESTSYLSIISTSSAELITDNDNITCCVNTKTINNQTPSITTNQNNTGTKLTWSASLNIPKKSISTLSTNRRRKTFAQSRRDYRIARERAAEFIGKDSFDSFFLLTAPPKTTTTTTNSKKTRSHSLSSSDNGTTGGVTGDDSDDIGPNSDSETELRHRVLLNNSRMRARIRQQRRATPITSKNDTLINNSNNNKSTATKIVEIDTETLSELLKKSRLYDNINNNDNSNKLKCEYNSKNECKILVSKVISNVQFILKFFKKII